MTAESDELPLVATLGGPTLMEPSIPVVRGIDAPLPEAWQKDLSAFENVLAWSRSTNTKRSYLQAVLAYWQYCLSAGLDRYAVASVASYVYACAFPRMRYLEDLSLGGVATTRGQEPGHGRAAIELAIAAIGRSFHQVHRPAPATHPQWALFMDGIRRRLHREADRKAPMLREDLKRAVEIARSHGNRLTGLRDAALMLLGWSCSLRRSELAAIGCEDLHDAPTGWFLRLARSKTNQSGVEVEEIPIYSAQDVAYDALHACHQWREAAGITQGPMFRAIHHGLVAPKALNPASIRLILRRYALRENTGGHSLRSGFATQACIDGKSDDEICVVTRHRDRKTLQRYKHLVDARRQGPGSLL